MFFTQDDYKKIQQWLIKNSVKDTEFNEANIPFNGEETITIVQGNQNKKVFLKDLIAQVFNLGISDFVNITDKYDAPNISLEEAIRLIPSRARKEGQVITFLDMEDHWHIYQFKGVLNQWNILDTWEDLFDFNINNFIIDSILPDEEDLTKSPADANGNSYLSLKDREYNPNEFSGLGRVILRKNIMEVEDPIYGKVKKNILYQDMFTQSNTVYECRYNFDLNGQVITLPDNSYIEYNGGSISNGTILDAAKSMNKTVLKKNIINGKNILTQELINKPNTIYIIQYDYDLNGAEITIPEGCVLDFQGGSLNNGYLIGSDTKIISANVIIFNNIDINGTWKVYDIYSDWFVCKSVNSIKNIFNLSHGDIINNIYLNHDNYDVTPIAENDDIVFLKSNTNIYIKGVINVLTNKYNKYNVFATSASNINITGGSIIGDKDTHPNIENVIGGYGFSSWGGKNIVIDRVTFKKLNCDAIGVNGSPNSPTENVSIVNCDISECRRNGISVTSANGFCIKNNKISNIEGIDPERCIDIEPNAECKAVNGLISGNLLNNIYGLMMTQLGSGTGNRVENIVIENNIITSNRSDAAAVYIITAYNTIIRNNKIVGGIRVRINTKVCDNDISGNLIFENCDIYNNIIRSKITNCDNVNIRNNIFNIDNEDTSSIISGTYSSIVGNIININSLSVSMPYIFDLRGNTKVESNYINYPEDKASLISSFISYRSGSTGRLGINKTSTRLLVSGSYSNIVMDNPNLYLDDLPQGTNVEKGCVFMHSVDDFRPKVWSGEKWVGEGGYTAATIKGTSSRRPIGVHVKDGTVVGELDKNKDIGFLYFDRTLMKPIWAKAINESTGEVTWVDATGINV